MRRARGADARAPAPTPRGAAQLAVAVALVAAGVAGGWRAPVAVGAALLLACAAGLAEVVAARRLRAGARGRPRLLPEPERDDASWVRLDQRGRVVGRPGRLPAERGLYLQRSVTLTWEDAFGFWRARRTEPAGREVCVPPAPDARLARTALGRGALGALERREGRDAASVRAYERGDGLRQIAWRQTAHHGELMSFDDAGADAAPVLVALDALDAPDDDALAATAAALLRALRRAPDVLLTDGVSSWRAPAAQERLLAALVAEPAGPGEASARSRHVERLATQASGRRRVLLVTCDASRGMGPELRRGPLGRDLVTVTAARGSGAARAREGRAEKDPPAADAPRHGRPARPGASPAALEALAGACCCALALLCLVPLASTIEDGDWVWWAAALLGSGAAAGSLAGALLRLRGAGRAARVGVALALAAAELAWGVGLVSSALAARRGAGLAGLTGALAPAADGAADPLGALAATVLAGAGQLAGARWDRASACWDLVVLLGCAGIAALACALSGTRRARPALALAPVALAVVDQEVMGATRPGWELAVAALALLLCWLSGARRERAARGAVVALVAVALSAAGTALAGRVPVSTGALAGAGAGAGDGTGTGLETLVDLSRELRRRSSARVLTYDTSADGPVYLRTGVLVDFDGSDWSYLVEDGERSDALSPLARAGRSGLWPDSAPGIVTVVTTDERPAPLPPGTAYSYEDDRTGEVNAVGVYVEPVRSEADLAPLPELARELAALGVPAGEGPGERLRAVPGTLPDAAREVVARARAEGAGAGDGLEGQLATVRWLVGYFTSGAFSYSLEAPGGDGQDNMAALGEFLTQGRGYCTHYATALTLLARSLGVSARVAAGYMPADSRDAAGSYEVTMRQLHAWCEVWLDGIGWVGVDVTPASGDAAGAGAAPSGTGADPAAPETPATPAEPTAPEGTPAEGADDPEVGAEGDDGEEGADAMPEAPTPADGGAPELPAWAAPVLLACLAAGAATGAVALAARHRRRRLARGDWELAWGEVCRAARRAGVRWDASATEDEVADAVAAALADDRLAARLREVARNACLARYGTGPVAADASGLPDDVRSLRRALAGAARRGRGPAGRRRR